MQWLLRLIVIGILLPLTSYLSPLYAQEDDKTTMFNPVEHAVISQTIAPDARGAGMGDVGVATDPDVNSQYWNPAKYPFCISRSGIALNYTPWLRQLVNDIDLAYVAGYYRIGDYSAISGSLRYFSLGEVFADDGMSVKPYEMSLDLAYSLMLSENSLWRQQSAGSTAICAMTIVRIPSLPRPLPPTWRCTITIMSCWVVASVSSVSV